METKEQTKQKTYGVFQDGVLTRTVLFKKHFFWKYKGYAFGTDYLDAIQKKYGIITTLKIVEQDTGKVFTIPYQDFVLLSEVIYTNYGKQRVLNIEQFKAIIEDYGTKNTDGTLQNGQRSGEQN